MFYGISWLWYLHTNIDFRILICNCPDVKLIKYFQDEPSFWIWILCKLGFILTYICRHCDSLQKTIPHLINHPTCLHTPFLLIAIVPNHNSLPIVSFEYIFFLIIVGYKKSRWWDEAILRVYKCALCSSMDWHLRFENVPWKVDDISCWERMTFLAFLDKKLTFMFYSIPHVIMYKFVNMYQNLILLKYKTLIKSFDSYYSLG